jgi:hypothetical protein
MDVHDPLAGGLAKPGTWIGFDIETTEFQDDDLPSGATCAAAGTPDGHVVHWYSLGPDGRPEATMTSDMARGMLQWLRWWQLAGHRVVAWNGAGFDLQVLARICGDRELSAAVMWDLYDPMLQMLRQRGFPVALARAGEGLGIPERKLMAGAEAPDAWQQGRFQEVLDYVAGDVRLTVRVAEAIEAGGSLRWVTRRGTVGVEPFDVLLPVREVIRLPPPDQSWMSDPIPLDRPVSWALPVLGAGV